MIELATSRAEYTLIIGAFGVFMIGVLVVAFVLERLEARTYRNRRK